MPESKTFAVIGGTGMIGSEVVEHLAGSGNDVLILSRNPPASLEAGTRHLPIDLRSGDGLADALSQATTVIDVANERKAAQEVLVEGTRSLMETCREAGIEHYVGISIIGCEQLDFSYYKAKAAQEAVIRESPVPWSLLKASQFHELLAMVFEMAGRYRIRPTGSIPLQTVSAAVAARRMAEMAEAGTSGNTELLAGPGVEPLSALSGAWRDVTGRRALPLPVALPGKTGRKLKAGALTSPDHAGPGPTFTEWLKATRS